MLIKRPTTYGYVYPFGNMPRKTQRKIPERSTFRGHFFGHFFVFRRSFGHGFSKIHEKVNLLCFAFVSWAQSLKISAGLLKRTRSYDFVQKKKNPKNGQIFFGLVPFGHTSYVQTFWGLRFFFSGLQVFF